MTHLHQWKQSSFRADGSMVLACFGCARLIVRHWEDAVALIKETNPEEPICVCGINQLAVCPKHSAASP